MVELSVYYDGLLVYTSMSYAYLHQLYKVFIILMRTIFVNVFTYSVRSESFGFRVIFVL